MLFFARILSACVSDRSWMSWQPASNTAHGPKAYALEERQQHFERYRRPKMTL